MVGQPTLSLKAENYTLISGGGRLTSHKSMGSQPATVGFLREIAVNERRNLSPKQKQMTDVNCDHKKNLGLPGCFEPFTRATFVRWLQACDSAIKAKLCGVVNLDLPQFLFVLPVCPRVSQKTKAMVFDMITFSFPSISLTILSIKDFSLGLDSRNIFWAYQIKLSFSPLPLRLPRGLLCGRSTMLWRTSPRDFPQQNWVQTLCWNAIW